MPKLDLARQGEDRDMLIRSRLPLEADDEGQKQGKDKELADPFSAAAALGQAPVTPATDGAAAHTAVAREGAR